MTVAVTVAGCDKYSISGRKPELIIGEHGFGPGQFHRPRAIACAPDGSVFVIDMTARVQRFSPDGEYETSWTMPESEAGKPTGITVDAAGRVLVADSHYYRVIIYDRDGHELKRFGSAGTGPGQFNLVSRVVEDKEGNYYVSQYGGNDRISRFSPSFEYLGSFGGPDAGEASLARPQAMAFDAEQTLWVADACHHRICRFSRTGQLLSSFGTLGKAPGQLDYPYGLAICPDGTLLVCEYGNNRLQRFDRTGKSLETWGGLGTGPGQMLDAWSVAIGKEGRVYVVDSRNHRVQMFRM
jgi:DNA-binding beta-propeller fold protein YncE